MKLLFFNLLTGFVVLSGCVSSHSKNDQAEAVKKYRQAQQSSLDDQTRIRLLSEAVKLYDEYPQAYLDRALLFDKLNNFSQAEKDYSSAIKTAPENNKPRYYFMRGRFYQEGKRDFKSAEDDYNNACKLGEQEYDNEIPSYYYFRGVLFQTEIKSDKALEDYNFWHGKIVVKNRLTSF